MINNRQVTISTAPSRKSTYWKTETPLWSQLVARLAEPVRSPETYEAYTRLAKARQDDLKDVGGYVAGELRNGRRKAGNVAARDVITLDLDNVPAGKTAEILARIETLSCGYCVYSTRKHSPAAPRLRVLLPASRRMAADEYEPCARRAAWYIDPTMAVFDPTTFETSRLMYWPSVCADAEYVYRWADKPFLDADGLLATYADWRDMGAWPRVPGADAAQERRIDKAAQQADPNGKSGIVGAFCRTYDVHRAMDELIPGTYDPVEGGTGRYTYSGGSTVGGAVIYGDGKFLYSHHATDPASGKLVNAWDLVRLHRFGAQDDEAKDGTPAGKLPSYAAMRELAVGLPEVSNLVLKERHEEAVREFSEITGTESAADEDDADWMAQIKKNSSTGLPEKTINNVWLILEHDPILKGKFAVNEFANRGEVLGPVPWSKNTERRFWDDNDAAGLYWYMENTYNLKSKGDVDSALSLHSNQHSFNEVQDYLRGLTWDGVSRLDTLFIDYLGAEDSEYTRAVTRKAFVAAVARAMTPGCKFDCMTVISGPQGIGKTTLLRTMGKGRWHTDSLRSFEGKDAAEIIQGVWLVEVGELDAMRRTDINRVKQFLSQQVDRFRAAYARNTKDCPRRCVFFGTCNDAEYLRDSTGNRRFWPVDAGEQAPTKNVFTELAGEVDQLWAEAVVRWSLGEPLFLPLALENQARDIQEQHREVSVWEADIREFLDRPIPEDWNRWTADQRMVFWGGGAVTADVKLVPRDRVCAREIIMECLGLRVAYLKGHEAAEVNKIIASIPGWRRQKAALKFGPYGAQRGFLKG